MSNYALAGILTGVALILWFILYILEKNDYF